MANPLPPPPTKAASGDFAWVDWYNKLNQILGSGGTVAWAQVNKQGSSLSDLQSRAHSQLTGIQGGGAYHLSQSQYNRVAGFISLVGNPTTTDLGNGEWGVFKNTTTNTVRLWANDGGTLKSVTLT